MAGPSPKWLLCNRLTGPYGFPGPEKSVGLNVTSTGFNSVLIKFMPDCVWYADRTGRDSCSDFHLVRHYNTGQNKIG